MMYKLIVDNGKPSEEIFKSKEDLFKKLKELEKINKNDYPYFDIDIFKYDIEDIKDLKRWDIRGVDVTDSIFKEFEGLK